MAIGLQNTDNVDAPGGNYPYGKVRDNDGSGNGTPANTKTLGDFHQFFARLNALASVVPNGLPENSLNGFQYNQALQILIDASVAAEAAIRAAGDNTLNTNKVNRAGDDSITGSLAIGGGVILDGLIAYKTKKITLSNWDMDTDPSKVEPHGLVGSKISSVYISVQDNIVGKYYNLLNAGAIIISATDIEMSRTPGGIYDSDAFVNTPIKIFIIYEV